MRVAGKGGKGAAPVAGLRGQPVQIGGKRGGVIAVGCQPRARARAELTRMGFGADQGVWPTCARSSGRPSAGISCRGRPMAPAMVAAMPATLGAMASATRSGPSAPCSRHSAASRASPAAEVVWKMLSPAARSGTSARPSSSRFTTHHSRGWRAPMPQIAQGRSRVMPGACNACSIPALPAEEPGPGGRTGLSSVSGSSKSAIQLAMPTSKSRARMSAKKICPSTGSSDT